MTTFEPLGVDLCAHAITWYVTMESLLLYRNDALGADHVGIIRASRVKNKP